MNQTLREIQAVLERANADANAQETEALRMAAMVPAHDGYAVAAITNAILSAGTRISAAIAATMVADRM